MAAKIKLQGRLLIALSKGAVIMVTNTGRNERDARKVYTLSTTGEEVLPRVVTNLLDGGLIKGRDDGLFPDSEPQTFEIVRNL